MDTILESIGTRKLIFLVSALVTIQVASFLIGGLLAPSKTSQEVLLGTKCFLNTSNSQNWYISQDKDNLKYCNILSEEHISANNSKFVFVFQVPLPRNDKRQNFSRWQQNLQTELRLDISDTSHSSITEKFSLVMEAKLGFQNDDNEWTLLSDINETRTINCLESDSEFQDCEPLSLFKLEGFLQQNYVINLQLFISSPNDSIFENREIFDGLTVTTVSNLTYAKVWIIQKIVCFLIIIILMIWYAVRIMQASPHPPILLSKLLFLLGTSLAVMNLPFELLPLWTDFPYVTLMDNIFTAIFYSVILIFCLIFCGEHLGEIAERNSLKYYWHYISIILFTCGLVFAEDVYHICVQLKNPFHYNSEAEKDIDFGIFIFASVAAFIYLAWLIYLVYSVFHNVHSKKSHLPTMSNTLSLNYDRTMTRLKFLMLATVLCILLLFISYFYNQVVKMNWNLGWNIPYFNFGPMLIGTYCYWNLYSLTIIVLYAPSYKYLKPSMTNVNIMNQSCEENEDSYEGQ